MTHGWQGHSFLQAGRKGTGRPIGSLPLRRLGHLEWKIHSQVVRGLTRSSAQEQVPSACSEKLSASVGKMPQNIPLSKWVLTSRFSPFCLYPQKMLCSPLSHTQRKKTMGLSPRVVKKGLNMN